MTAIETRAKNAKIWARDADDFYCEPEWCSTALFATEQFDGDIVDPACGLGRIVSSARAFGYDALGSDKVVRSDLCQVCLDFLVEREFACANIVTDPPFSVADKFVARALSVATGKVVMLLPATWHFGAKRAAWLKTTPLRRIYALNPRPSMPPGAVILAGEKPGGGIKDFSWYVWLRGYDGPVEMRWLHRNDAEVA